MPQNKLTQYLIDARKELKNVTWPTRAEVKKHTILVIIISLAVALFLGLCDYIIGLGIEQVIK